MFEDCDCNGANKKCYWCKGRGTVINDHFPKEDVSACPRISTLEIPDYEMQSAIACPLCNTPPQDLNWVYFKSPSATWAWLCGVSGYLTICEKCQIQVDFFIFLRN